MPRGAVKVSLRRCATLTAPRGHADRKAGRGRRDGPIGPRTKGCKVKLLAIHDSTTRYGF